ncbi:hypothetical protein GS534_08955 [Rhodococcus hoagii]|nr:hypothetical protein [Prescottella equi]
MNVDFAAAPTVVSAAAVVVDGAVADGVVVVGAVVVAVVFFDGVVVLFVGGVGVAVLGTALGVAVVDIAGDGDVVAVTSDVNVLDVSSGNAIGTEAVLRPDPVHQTFQVADPRRAAWPRQLVETSPVNRFIVYTCAV